MSRSPYEEPRPTSYGRKPTLEEIAAATPPETPVVDTKKKTPEPPKAPDPLKSGI